MLLKPSEQSSLEQGLPQLSRAVKTTPKLLRTGCAPQTMQDPWLRDSIPAEGSQNPAGQHQPSSGGDTST